jgi:oligopeptide transport system ATP-binding protein
LIKPSSGEIWLEDRNIADTKRSERLDLRKKAQIIFQDPYSSLNPRMTVGASVEEALIIHKILPSKRERRERVLELIKTVGLPAEHADRFPHELSGGQRQRIGIARALAVNPTLIVCDEPVSALDMSVQAQIVNLLQDLQDRLGLTYIFIAHDLSVVEYISTRVAVMYLGKIVEIAPTSELYSNPTHPYSQALLSAAPIPDPSRKQKRNLLEGDMPSPLNPPAGCRFHTRCAIRTPSCSVNQQTLKEISPGHWVACQVRTGESASKENAT